MRITKLAVALVAASSLLLAGCASEPSTDRSQNADGELTKVTVSYIPLSMFGGLYTGIDEGIFAKHGLEIELVPQSDVGTIVSGVASGQYDFGFATAVHVINARNNGIPIKMVATADGSQSPDEAPDEGNAMLAGPDSGITSVADLEGKRVAVVGLSSLNTLTVMKLADEAGVDVDSIEFVQLPFPQMPSELAAGTVDAAVTQAPFIAEALATGSTVTSKPNVELFGGYTMVGFNSNEQFIAENEELVKAFSEAMTESITFAWENPDMLLESTAKAMGLTLEAATAQGVDPNLALPSFNTDGFAAVQDLLVEYENLATPKPVEEFVWIGAITK